MEYGKQKAFFLNMGMGKKGWFSPTISGKMPNYTCDGVVRLSPGLKTSEVVMTGKIEEVLRIFRKSVGYIGDGQ